MARQFAGASLGSMPAAAPPLPAWATPNTVALELKVARLRDFSSTAEGVPTLLCAPFALHGSTIADLAPGHSLVATLRDAGLRRLFVTDWRSATPEMRLLTIDDYLAALNVMVDQLGGAVDLIGLCQGGWMSLLFAARFPGKVRKLVLAGAPVDTAAGTSALSVLAHVSPDSVFSELVRLGEGRVLGHMVKTYWSADSFNPREIVEMLQTKEPYGSPAYLELEAAVRAWEAYTVDLPGSYYLEIIERLYKRNEIATSRFIALGETIDLSQLRTPLYLLVARDDELVAPEQLFALEHLVGTSPNDLRKATAPCQHVGLFIGRDVLAGYWTDIARWIAAPDRETATPAAA